MGGKSRRLRATYNLRDGDATIDTSDSDVKLLRAEEVTKMMGIRRVLELLSGKRLPLVGFAALLVSALLTAVYMFQVVLKAWFPRTDAPAIPEGSAHEAGWMMTVPTAVLAAACLVMGLFPQWLLDVIGKAVGL